ncbi:hypothetical protein BC938DRAFT_475640 [Jimgerdemannia flammicorona]|uniref:Uncharacterized protein n=1 Tax=Jimgerdemannia flammicorona TaxID=994334 RepID=A0A433PR73_9FUNG|nr:hypothetical protein BC938DRAFT_475640 [Jimgerdemannia flammicorona]
MQWLRLLAQDRRPRPVQNLHPPGYAYERDYGYCPECLQEEPPKYIVKDTDGKPHNIYFIQNYAPPFLG